MPLFPIDPFAIRHLQDLAWVIQSPSLISHASEHAQWLSSQWWQDEYQACRPILESLNADWLLQQSKQLKTKRLGERFELLVEQWLNISPNFRCLARNIPIRRHKQTLGEIDFIIQEISTGKIIHLEVAIKFYLCKTQGQSMDDWYGPALRDRLDLKYNKLKQHQSQLSRHYPEMMPYPIDERWLMLKGRLFYPIQAQQKPSFLSQDHLTGRWAYPSQLAEQQTLHIITKPDWLADINRHKHPSTLDRFDLTQPLKRPQCAIESSDKQEKQRWFLVPEKHWSITTQQ